MASPPSNVSEVSSQSTLPSFRAMKPSRLATMWMVTQDSMLATVTPPRAVASCAFPKHNVSGAFAGHALHALVTQSAHVDSAENVLACSEQNGRHRQVEFVDEPGPEVLPDRGDAAANPNVFLACCV